MEETKGKRPGANGPDIDKIIEEFGPSSWVPMLDELLSRKAGSRNCRGL